MSETALQIYVCNEPDHELIARRIDSWPWTCSDIESYQARCAIEPDSPAAEPIKAALREQILAADVVLCIVGQTTFMDPWIDWELRTAREKPDRHGFVAIMLDDLYPHPPALLNAGTMFIKMRKTYVIDAVAWAAEQSNPTEDFVLEE